MIDTDTSPEALLRAYERAAGEVADLDRRIANMTRWGQPKADSVNATILPSLIAKRDRLLPIVADLKARAPAIRPRNFDVAQPIAFKSFSWGPIGSAKIDDCIPDLPPALRRSRS